MAKEEGRPASVDNQQDQRHQGLKATVKKKKATARTQPPAPCALQRPTAHFPGLNAGCSKPPLGTSAAHPPLKKGPTAGQACPDNPKGTPQIFTRD